MMYHLHVRVVFSPPRYLSFSYAISRFLPLQLDISKAATDTTLFELTAKQPQSQIWEITVVLKYFKINFSLENLALA